MALPSSTCKGEGMFLAPGPASDGPLGPVSTNEAASATCPMKDTKDEESEDDGDPEEVRVAIARVAHLMNGDVGSDPFRIGIESRGSGIGIERCTCTSRRRGRVPQPPIIGHGDSQRSKVASQRLKLGGGTGILLLVDGKVWILLAATARGV